MQTEVILLIIVIAILIALILSRKKIEILKISRYYYCPYCGFELSKGFLGRFEKREILKGRTFGEIKCPQCRNKLGEFKTILFQDFKKKPRF